jgi:hypothetical protein
VRADVRREARAALGRLANHFGITLTELIEELAAAASGRCWPGCVQSKPSTTSPAIRSFWRAIVRASGHGITRQERKPSPVRAEV